MIRGAGTRSGRASHGARFGGLLACVLAGCSSSTAGSSATTDAASTTDGGAPVPTREPKVHRATATTCPTDRKPGTPGTMPRPGDTCTRDADCADPTKGRNGRCNQTLQGNVCTYDACAADADCGSAGVCACRLATVAESNVCFRGNCRTDADCKASWCSPSGVDVSSSCPGLPIGTIGYFCHSAADACVDDTDCPGVGESCAFDPDLLHFRCFQLRCRG